MTPVPSLAVANFFLARATEERRRLTPMQLQKLVYFAHGWFLGLTGKPLIEDIVEAWKWGPVISEVYHHFKCFGRERITSRALRPDGSEHAVQDDEAVRVLSKVWDVYKGFSGPQMSNLTHQPGTPWYRVYEESGGESFRRTVIPEELIRKHYERRIQQASR